MKFTIDRTKWIRGEGYNESYLLRLSDSKMCCLGFFSLACGLTPEEIYGKRGISLVMKEFREKYPEWVFPVRNNQFVVSIDAGALEATNDSKYTSEGEREEFIRAAFSKHGIEVEFIN